MSKTDIWAPLNNGQLIITGHQHYKLCGNLAIFLSYHSAYMKRKGTRLKDGKLRPEIRLIVWQGTLTS